MENFMPSASRRNAFSFIELLVVITIIGILVALLLPAVQAAREAARRSSCQRNLSQLILAVHSYKNLHGVSPPGTIEPQGPIRNVAQGFHHNWIVQILPHMEQDNAWSYIDSTVGVYDPKNAPVAKLKLDVLQCPSQSPTRTPQTCYGGVHHDREAPIDVTNNGVFFLNSFVRYEDVTDGSSHTIFLGEMFPENGGLGWMSGTRATLRNAGVGAGAAAPGAVVMAQNAVDAIVADLQEKRGTKKRAPIDPLLVVGGFGSVHPGGAQYAFGDGRAMFLAAKASPKVARLLAHRADGMLLDEDSY
jgi:prepilin-type N-terminal cleavage/methylation domain-containing protein